VSNRRTLLFGGFFLGLLALILRFWHLSDVPVGLYHDEMDYVITGAAIVRDGGDLSGNWRPSSLLPLETLNITAELPAIFHAFFQALFGATASSSHIPAAFFGLTTVLLTSFFTHALTKNKVLAVFVGIFLALNPWHIYISRLGYEAVISVFFQLLFLYSFWNGLVERRKKGILAYLVVMTLSFFFAFFTYHAAKISIIAIVVAVITWLLVQRSVLAFPKARVGVLIVVIISCVAWTWFSPAHELLSRRESDTIFSAGHLASIVDTERRFSLETFGGLDAVLLSKPSFLLQEFTRNYLSVFDVYRIFVTGYEGGFQFSLAVHGFFYLSSVPLLFLGIGWWLRNKPREFSFLCTIVLVAPIASAISVSQQSVFRSALVYLILVLFSGTGAYALLNRFKQKSWKRIVAILIIVVFIAEALWFGFRYFSRYPIVSADNHYFFERLLANYVVRTTDDSVLVLVESDPYRAARAIILYNQLLPTLTTEERGQFAEPKAKSFTFGRITVTQNCQKESFTGQQIAEPGMIDRCKLFDSEEGESAVQLGLGSPIDSRMYYVLMDKSFCEQYALNTFIHTTTLATFGIEELGDEVFCKSWVIKEEK